MSEANINILTLNCWGLKYVAKNRVERVQAIASAISQSAHDIVALQELWVYADFEYVRSWVTKRLPYAKFFYSGALGAGLALFSRFPILTAAIHPYSLNGHPLDVAGGDWFVGKAAASIVIRHPTLGEVEIFNTHLFAKGGEVGPEHLRAHRLVNAWEFSKLVRVSASAGRYVIAAGDFNSIPKTLPMTIIRDYAGLSDAWSESHETGRGSPRDLRPEDAITLFGVTADSPLNSYSSGKPLDTTARQHFGKRLDYIFYRQPTGGGAFSSADKPLLKCKESRVVFTDNVPGHSFSFSDHFGLEATIAITLPDSHGTHPSSQDSVSLSEETFSSMTRALTGCYRISAKRSRLELLIFATCIVALVALCIGSVWLPRSWINPIYLLLTVFISWAGTTTLYAGFIFGNWERRALTNVIEELEFIGQRTVQGAGRIADIEASV
ncbi:hypothetical protein EW145_g5572 [Phellinidium pouzarii]|uniref:Endonuclease/exonuclease/phosphatase domain-containing protein n=1 Tax=Phellinidium pouzarii TaxID=167371 RepID=A0A4S4L497_9AGAM|nr:hypothetical protein EW145_g5572 [Phellinidium pouzarii]